MYEYLPKAHFSITYQFSCLSDVYQLVPKNLFNSMISENVRVTVPHPISKLEVQTLHSAYSRCLPHPENIFHILSVRTRNAVVITGTLNIKG
jgi:hypothetical protein